MRSLCESAGLPGRVFDANEMRAEVDGISDRLSSVLAEGEALRGRLRQWGAEQRDLAPRNAQIVADIAKRLGS